MSNNGKKIQFRRPPQLEMLYERLKVEELHVTIDRLR